jgi:ferredoxin-NADP reductase
MNNAPLELIKIVTHCCDVKTFRFALSEDVAFKPGQYLVATLPVDGKDVSKALSISSSPTEKGYIEFTKKISNSGFSQQLLKLEAGQRVAVRFPMGRFTFEGEHPKAVFLSGGIGITPIRSIFKNATDKKLSTRLTLLYSSRTPEYLIFKKDFEAMARQNPLIKLVYTLTQCDQKVEGCRAGYIDPDMIKEEVPDFAQCVFYICGPPAMVDAMKTMLLIKLQLPVSQIITEDFVGY